METHIAPFKMVCSLYRPLLGFHVSFQECIYPTFLPLSLHNHDIFGASPDEGSSGLLRKHLSSKMLCREPHALWVIQGYKGLYRDSGKENGSYYLGFRVERSGLAQALEKL